MEDEPAESLLVTEVVTPAGHWSSYPPHKHDVDDPPRETCLEETYYHRIRPGGRFRVPARLHRRTARSTRRSPSATATSCSCRGAITRSPPGARHDLYYLNVMAGPTREWRVTVDPGFA